MYTEIRITTDIEGKNFLTIKAMITPFDKEVKKIPNAGELAEMIVNAFRT